MSTKLYIDFLSSDGAVGITKSKRSVQLNFSVLDRANRINERLFIAGKYVCFTPAESDPQFQMIFFDTKGHPGWVKRLAKHPIISESASNELESVVKKLKDHYDELASQFTLTLDSPE